MSEGRDDPQAAATAPTRSMRVFLIHGMGRSRASMLLLGSRLKRAGFKVTSYGYTVSTTAFDDIGQGFIEHIAQTQRADEEEAGPGGKTPVPYAIVGHSLGNIITRYVWHDLPAGVQNVVMLAPPNSSPKLARTLKNNPVFKVLTGEAGQQLADEQFYRELPVPDVPTLVLAGDGGPRLSFLPFGDERSDGVVALSETGLEGAVRRVLPLLHTFIMNDKRVARMVAHFAERGTLSEGAAGTDAADNANKGEASP